MDRLVESVLLWLKWTFDKFPSLFVLAFATSIAYPLFLFAFSYSYGAVAKIAECWSAATAAEWDSSTFWKAVRTRLAAILSVQSSIWHRHDFVGLEKIPRTGGALIVVYHGTVPLDMYYVWAKVLLILKRTVFTVVDRFLFTTPGYCIFLKNIVNCMEGSPEECIKILQRGDILMISPGGVREAQFSRNYELIWGHRRGFAKVAQAARVPIIPMFTRNISQAAHVFPFFKARFRKVYEKTRWPSAPVYGSWPVKLRTYFGDPISHDAASTPEALTLLVGDRLCEMIQMHQPLPGSTWRALKERWSLEPIEEPHEHTE